MKAEEEIRAKINWLRGYIQGQKSSYAVNEADLLRAMHALYTLEWVCDVHKEFNLERTSAYGNQ